jgi:hypothetical protein
MVLYPSDDELDQFKTSRKKRSLHEWYARVRELVDFENVNGHMNVPQVYTPNKKLGNWVNKQRGAARERLSVKQLAILERVGFPWGTRKGKLFWNEKMLELEAYKEEHGNCKYEATWMETPVAAILLPTHDYRASPNQFTLYVGSRVPLTIGLVPTKYETNPSLGRFVSTQRSEYKKFRAPNARTLITEERVRRLNDIGFVWALPNRTAI